MSEHALRPCPFCGMLPTQALRHSSINDDESWHAIACENRECSVMPIIEEQIDGEGSGEEIWMAAAELAADKWNTRPLEQELLAACKEVAGCPSNGSHVLVSRGTLVNILAAIKKVEATEWRAG